MGATKRITFSIQDVCILTSYSNSFVTEWARSHVPIRNGKYAFSKANVISFVESSYAKARKGRKEFLGEVLKNTKKLTVGEIRSTLNNKKFEPVNISINVPRPHRIRKKPVSLGDYNEDVIYMPDYTYTVPTNPEWERQDDNREYHKRQAIALIILSLISIVSLLACILWQI